MNDIFIQAFSYAAGIFLAAITVLVGTLVLMALLCVSLDLLSKWLKKI